MASHPKSYAYGTRVSWSDGRAGDLASAGKPTFRVASPPEFKGEAGTWTPEDLFVAAAEACTMTTFLSFAERAGIEVLAYDSSAEGTLELVEGGFRFTRVMIKARIVVDRAQVDVAKKTMHDAHEKCLIARSMACPVAVEADVVAG